MSEPSLQPWAARGERPPIWIGHVVLEVPDIAASRAFGRLGMRDLGDKGVAILEMRAGPPLVLIPGDSRVEGEDAPFDLMVDDLDEARGRYAAARLSPPPLAENEFHRHFTVVAPSGHVVTVNSSHVDRRRSEVCATS